MHEIDGLVQERRNFKTNDFFAQTHRHVNCGYGFTMTENMLMKDIHSWHVIRYH